MSNNGSKSVKEEEKEEVITYNTRPITQRKIDVFEMVSVLKYSYHR